MKATLEFNLPEDQHEYDLVVTASQMFNALWEISQELRSICKYEELSEKEWEMADKIRDKFFEILNDNNISLN
jgi:hypothetical protein